MTLMENAPLEREVRAQNDEDSHEDDEEPDFDIGRILGPLWASVTHGDEGRNHGAIHSFSWNCRHVPPS